MCEGAGDYAFEYMTSGTGMVLGECGNGFGNGASGGIIFAYDDTISIAEKAIKKINDPIATLV